MQSTHASYYILLHLSKNHTESFQVLIKIYHHLRLTKESVKLGTLALVALVLLRCRDAIATIREESKPPDKNTPNGTLVMSLLITTC